MFTTNQIVAHLIGDYVLQSHTEAQKKTADSWWAMLHAIKYTLPFLLITRNADALLVILLSHFLIDRFRLARFVNYLKNCWSMWGEKITATGYPESTPEWLSVWLLIITDNILHIVINAFVIYHS